MPVWVPEALMLGGSLQQEVASSSAPPASASS
jgi:hypothetical protein